MIAQPVKWWLNVAALTDNELWDLCREFYGNDLATMCRSFRAEVARVSDDHGFADYIKDLRLDTALPDQSGEPQDYRCGAFIAATGEQCILLSDHGGEHKFASESVQQGERTPEEREN